MCSENCLERPLPWETTCLDRPHIFGRRTCISIYLNLSLETTCLDRPHFCGQWGSLSRQILQYLYILVTCINTYNKAGLQNMQHPYQVGRKTGLFMKYHEVACPGGHLENNTHQTLNDSKWFKTRCTYIMYMGFKMAIWGAATQRGVHTL